MFPFVSEDKVHRMKELGTDSANLTILLRFLHGYEHFRFARL